MIVLDIHGFRNASLRFADMPGKAELIASAQAGFAFDTGHKSYAPFQKLVREALEGLRTIGTDEPYVLIMSSYYRFDDASGDHDWRAVQIGSYLVNNGSYFRRLPDPENRHYSGGKLASDLLERLEAENWRTLFRDISGLEPGDEYYPREFGLLRNEGGEYLVLGDSVNGDRSGGIYEISDLQDFEFVGFPEGLDDDGYDYEVDDKVDRGQPIRWECLSSWAEGMLEGWDGWIRRQESRRLSYAVIDIPNDIRRKALRYIAKGDVLSADATVSDSLGLGRWHAARAWVETISRGLGVNDLSPGYLREACGFVRRGNSRAAADLMIEGAGFTENEARNWK